MEKPKILVVDDENEVRLSIKSYLTRHIECDLREASSGRQALEMINKDAFDLILLDVRMPGISGIDVLKQAHSLHPESAILMITAYDSQQVAREALKNGAMDYIIKPSTIDVIFKKIKQILEKRKQYISKLANQ